MVGSIANLYNSIENLNESFIQPNKAKETLLKPIPSVGISSVPLLLKEDSKTDRKFYRCSTQAKKCLYRVSDYPNAICPQCKRTMTTVVPYVSPPGEQASSTEGGFVKGVVTYMVMDNLVVKPMSAISSTITLLNKFNVVDVGTLRREEVTLGMEEALTLLKASLRSKKVLTEVFRKCW
ncbi:uncharacterized protein [Primulina huaijiensis]|uniref:uncharacterized protein n=1 Tax=Primulina huaijiensis TaxID=1492673 RepID=UPI003CC73126